MENEELIQKIEELEELEEMVKEQFKMLDERKDRIAELEVALSEIESIARGI